jgi:hypothetical protein
MATRRTKLTCDDPASCPRRSLTKGRASVPSLRRLAPAPTRSRGHPETPGLAPGRPVCQLDGANPGSPTLRFHAILVSGWPGGPSRGRYMGNGDS